jgi:DNA-binding NtrC family response regulator
MQQTQVLVYENDGKLAESLKDLAQAHGFRLREIRQEKACFNLLHRGAPGVLVLKVGRDLERELRLLERISWLFPQTEVIAVGHRHYPGLAGLAWDLGACFVLFPPQPLELLPELVRSFLPAKGSEEYRIANRE